MSEQQLQVIAQNQNALLNFDPAKVELIKKTVAKGATNDELGMFMHLCQTYQLDPFRKEIWFIKRGNDPTIMTSRDGYLKIAQNDPNFVGLQGFVVKEGDTFEIDAENFKVVHKFGAKRGKIIGAWAAAYHRTRKPSICFVDFAEYFEVKSPVWQKYPSAMIQKVAEVFVLKRQFGISGLVTKEELSMPQEEMEPVVEYQEQPQEEKRLDDKTIRLLHAIRGDFGKTEDEFKEGLSKMRMVGFKVNSLHDLAKLPKNTLSQLIKTLQDAAKQRKAQQEETAVEAEVVEESQTQEEVVFNGDPGPVEGE